MFKFNSQITKLKDKTAATEYSIQITTDNYEQYKFIQDMARECVDGKHKEAALSASDWIRAYPDEASDLIDLKSLDDQSKLTSGYVPPACKSCPNHSSNGGTGDCNCTLGGPSITYGV